MKYDTKLEFGFDEERILKDGLYTVEEIYDIVDNYMADQKATKTGRGTYEGDWETESDKFVGVGFVFLQTKWFRKYVNKWIFKNPEEGEYDCLIIMREQGNHL
ncbi:MAG: hypothetical protein WBO70_00795 [Erysipelotrichaceae bacterium]